MQELRCGVRGEKQGSAQAGEEVNPFAPPLPTCYEFIDVWQYSKYESMPRGTNRSGADLAIKQAAWGDGECRFSRDIEREGNFVVMCVRVLRDREEIIPYLLSLDMREFATPAMNGTSFISKESIHRAVVAGGWQDRSLFS